MYQPILAEFTYGSLDQHYWKQNKLFNKCYKSIQILANLPPPRHEKKNKFNIFYK